VDLQPGIPEVLVDQHPRMLAAWMMLVKSSNFPWQDWLHPTVRPGFVHHSDMLPVSK
jgi:hypothetical protein